MLKIGLTGGICAGKSTVLQELAALGAAVIDADKLGHKTYTVGSEPYHNLVAQFGDEIVAKDSKEIDRKVLGGLVFGKDNPRMKQLTDIVWPAVNRMLLEEFEIQKAAGTAVVVVENAMLLDMNMDKLVDTVWVCCVDVETARARLMQRNGFTSEEAGQRIAAQRSNDQRCAHADVILWNGGTETEMASKVRDAFGNVAVIRRKRQAAVFRELKAGAINMDEAQQRLSKM